MDSAFPKEVQESYDLSMGYAEEAERAADRDRILGEVRHVVRGMIEEKMRGLTFTSSDGSSITGADGHYVIRRR